MRVWIGASFLWSLAVARAEPMVVTPEEDMELVLPRGGESLTLVVDVPEGTAQWGLAVVGRDPVLTVEREGDPSSRRRARGTGRAEALTWGHDGAPPVTPGRWIVQVREEGRRPSDATLLQSFRRDRVESMATSLTGGALFDPTLDVVGRLTDGMSLTRVVGGESTYETFSFDVPKRVRTVTIALSHAEPGLEIHAAHGDLIGDYDEAGVVSAATKRADEVLVLRREDVPGAWAGRWYVDLFSPDGTLATDVSLQFDTEPDIKPFEETAERLTVGRIQRFRLGAEGARHVPFVLDVPPAVEKLYAQVWGVRTDVDLFARAGEPMISLGEATWSSREIWTSEPLTISAEEGALPTGPLYIDAYVVEDEPVEGMILVSDQPLRDLDAAALPLPMWPTAQGAEAGPEQAADVAEASEPRPPVEGTEMSALERVRRATVRITSGSGLGSGVVVDSRGWILTAQHVLADDDGVVDPDAEVRVSLSLMRDLPPEEVFQAEILGHDEELDLALLRVTHDIFGRPVPEGLQLPSVTLGDVEELELGEALWVSGFPSVASPQSVPSFTVTRGIVGGFERDEQGAREWIKTDTRMNSGASGGPVSTEDGRVFGLVNESIWDEDDVMWFSRPVTLVPGAWWEAAAEARVPDDPDEEGASEP